MKKKWALAGLAGLLCVVLAAVGASGCGGENSSGSAGPGQVVKDFWESAARGDAQAAYDLFSSEDQAEMAYEDFEKIVAEDPPGEDLKVEVVSEKTDGDKATVTVSIQGNQGEMDLVKEGGAWKLDGIAELLMNASTGSDKAECLDNLRTMDSAIMQFAAATGTFPSTLEELIPNYIRKMPVCPAGGTYTLTTSADSANIPPDVSCSVHGDY